MNEKYPLELLKNVQLFQDLPDLDLQRISKKISFRKFRKTELILYEEDTNEYMYAILSGKVKVTQVNEEGKETILALHNAGDFFGDISLLDGKTVPASVYAIEDTITGIISRHDFLSMIFSERKVLEVLLQILCGRLRESWDKIHLLNFKNAAQRMKMLFRMLSEEYGKKIPDSIKPDSIKLDIKLTHQDMANMTGLTRETVTRVLDKWQKDGTMKMLGKTILVSDPDFFVKDLKRDF